MPTTVASTSFSLYMESWNLANINVSGKIVKQLPLSDYTKIAKGDQAICNDCPGAPLNVLKRHDKLWSKFSFGKIEAPFYFLGHELPFGSPIVNVYGFTQSFPRQDVVGLYEAGMQSTVSRLTWVSRPSLASSFSRKDLPWINMNKHNL